MRVLKRFSTPCLRRAVRAVLLVPALGLALATPAPGGYSPDEPPTQTPKDPGDVFFLDGTLEVDDTCPPVPPFPAPCLGVPDDDNFDLDAVATDQIDELCPAAPAFPNPGILFSLDDGDPGAGSGPPARATELFFYDRCNLIGGGSYRTNADEAFVSLGTNPPPSGNDDDVDAYEARDIATYFAAGGAIVFSPDEPGSGSLPADPTCPGSPVWANLYGSTNGSSSNFYATPCSLGLPDISDCDIDAVTFVTNDPQLPAPHQILFSTDAQHDCGVDPGDIFISDNGGAYQLWADDVNDLKIARNESQAVDLDALSVNADGPIAPGSPFDPWAGFTFKRGWPDYAPSGVPDFSQRNPAFGSDAWCGPTALADCFWWFDAEMEGGCPGGAPGDGDDDCRLVELYPNPPITDDHDPANVEPLVQDLAACLGTDPVQGTHKNQILPCVNTWLNNKSLTGGFGAQRIDNPNFGQLACAVERSENVLVYLGFWNNPASKCGGHYVTAAGVQRSKDPGADSGPGVAGADDDADGIIDDPGELCPCGPSGPITYGDDNCQPGPDDFLIVSDPGLDNAEAGGPGRVLGPAHANHFPLVPGDHDVAENVSQDQYAIAPSGIFPFQISIPSGYAQPDPGQPTDCENIQQWCHQNPSDDDPILMDCVGAVSVEIETIFAIAPTVTDVCVDVSNGLGNLLVHKGSCPAPACVPNSYDYIRGELCQLSEGGGQVDLGQVSCMYDDTCADEEPDGVAWDITSGIGAWFYLVREDILGCDYGTSSAGSQRFASSGDCVCP